VLPEQVGRRRHVDAEYAQAEPGLAPFVVAAASSLGVASLKRDPELAQAVRATAYFLWEQDGRPEGRAFEYWLKAKEIHQRQLAYDRWLAEGSPEGRDLDIWVEVSQEIDES
jgi:hypothetical protein